MTTVHKNPRPEFRNIGIAQILRYRMPVAGLVSILHRVSGAGMFLLLPLVLWAFDLSLRSAADFARVAAVLASWPVKCIAVGLFWALAHHLCAGVRFLYMDVCHAVSKDQGRRLGVATLVVSLAATGLFALHLFFGA